MWYISTLSPALLRARDQEKRSHRVIQKITNEAGNNTIFTPIVLSASGAISPSTVAFLKDVYARAKAAGKFKTQRPDTKYTWNTMVAPSFWDMRLSVACTATDAEFQNRIIIRDRTSPSWRGSPTPTLTTRRTRRRARP